MPVLPIPMIIALVLFAFLAHRMVTRETHATLLALIAVCAVQGVISRAGAVLRRHGHPALAALTGERHPGHRVAGLPSGIGRHTGQRDLAHPFGRLRAGAAVSSAASRLLLDILIPALFAGYGVAMLLRLGRGEDSLPHSRLRKRRHVRSWPGASSRVSLIASALADVVIAYYLAIGETGVLLWVPSVVSSLTLLSLGAVSLSHAIEGKARRSADEETSVSPEDSERHQSIVARLDDYVETQKPFLDPDLTLARLSQKT